jgi:isocitrate dehydrogenase
VTITHQGNAMKVTERAFKDRGYDVAKKEFRNQIITEMVTLILSAKETDPEIKTEDIAREISPNFEKLTAEQQEAVLQDVEKAL